MKDETYKKLIVGILFNELWFEKKNRLYPLLDRSIHTMFLQHA